MYIIDIPLARKVGIGRGAEHHLTPGTDKSNNNHLQAVYASAPFTLAESAGGDALRTHFPALVGKVVPVLRNSQFKYKKPAITTVTAFASIAEDAITSFTEQLQKKNRSSIQADVDC